MAAQIIDGIALSDTIRAELLTRIQALGALNKTPGLAVVLVGDDPASSVYVRNKIKSCKNLGIYSEEHRYPANIDQEAIVQKIQELNKDKKIHGILVQLPLPEHFNLSQVLDAITPEKDVDGFHPKNMGLLARGTPRFIPCTPYGIMKMLEHYNVDPSGKEAVVIGRSNIVGKPIALLLLSAGATVTLCHSKTADLALHTRRADILIAAVGQPKMIQGDLVKPGAVLIDVGINRITQGEEKGKLCGDMDFASCEPIASKITPVPGGVGPMTITMLLNNTVEAAERM